VVPAWPQAPHHFQGAALRLSREKEASQRRRSTPASVADFNSTVNTIGFAPNIMA